jgi:gamma-glutamyltranspeptidase / glutathione hydrolase
MTWEASERHMLEQCVQAFFPLATRTVEGRHGVVTTTSSPLAAHAGFRALKAGGTVANAAVAVALTQITTALGSYVSYAGIMQALYHKAVGGKTCSLDAGWNTYLQETDPASIPLCDSAGESASRGDIAHGRKTLVPGFMAGVEALHDRFGRLPFSALLDPAIWYAENGITISADLASFFKKREDVLSRTPEGRRFLNQAGPALPQVRDRFDIFWGWLVVSPHPACSAGAGSGTLRLWPRSLFTIKAPGSVPGFFFWREPTY